MPTKKKPAAKPKKSSTENKTSNQKDLIIVMVISIILGLGGGYILGANNSSTKSTDNTVEETTTAHMHSTLYEVNAETAPKVELVVSEDAKSGYNVKIIATDFTFTPENINEANVLNEGHAHLYVDGVKVARLYGPYYHYDGTFEGAKTFRVTLNANDHSEYAVGEDVIDAEVVVTHDSSDPDHDEMHMNSENSEDDHMHSDM